MVEFSPSDFDTTIRGGVQGRASRVPVVSPRRAEQLNCVYELRLHEAARLTNLALRHSPQGLDQFKPLLGSVSLFDLIQPRHG